jgi:hypothetical protein
MNKNEKAISVNYFKTVSPRNTGLTAIDFSDQKQANEIQVNALR